MAKDFGPPRFPPLAFFWALVQPVRAAWWQLRFAELRKLAVRCALVTFGLAAALLTAAFVGAAPLQRWLSGGQGGVAGGVELVLVHFVLAVAALVAAVQLQGAVTQAFNERMSLFVQRRVTGDAPEPRLGKRRVLLAAMRSLVPTFTSLLLWAVTAAAAATLVLVPPFGPLLVVPVQLVLAAAFLAHSAVAQVRPRLGLPPRLYLRHPACMLGLALGFLPFVMLPPLALVGAGAISIGGTFVGLGIQRVSAASSGAGAPLSPHQPADLRPPA